MALNFAKKGKATAEAAAENTQAPKKSMGFMLKGNAAKQAMEKEEAKAEAAKADAGRMFRYWMALDSEDRRVTFLDGDLDKDGMLDANAFYEHSVKQDGNFKQYVCTEQNGGDQQEPCPICASGDKESRPYLAQVFTVIDHTPYKIQNGPNKGKIIKNSRKLFVAKSGTQKLLQKKATKHGGLAGVTFDISRTGDKSPGVGSAFDFVEKFDDLDSLMDKYELKAEDVQPANYDEEVPYHTADELVALGVGKAHGGFGYEGKSASKSALKNEL